MDSKKISFGFSKIIKKSNIILKKPLDKSENKVELIKCLEEQSIQLVENKQEEQQLIIPLKESRKTSAALASLLTRQSVLNGEETSAESKEQEATPAPATAAVPIDETIDQKAARELVEELQNKDSDEPENNSLVLPIVSLDGGVESTLDDYDSIPITQFGLAMLRGMGWKDQPKKKAALVEEGPVVRPKGMGLGADKAVKAKPLLVAPEANEKLELRKNAYIRILGGKHKDLYAQVEGLDEHAGRVIVKLALGGTRECLNEFLVQPVSKKEFSQYGKVINSAKYEEYKKLENKHGQIKIKKEEDDNDEKPRSVKSRDHSAADHRDKTRPKRHSDSDSEHSSPSRDSHVSKRYSNKEESNSHKRRSRSTERPAKSRDTNHKSSKSRRNRQSSDSDSSQSNTYKYYKQKSSSKSRKHKNKDKYKTRSSSSEDEKRHKKKTKKSKKQRSRSRSKGR